MHMLFFKFAMFELFVKYIVENLYRMNVSFTKYVFF